MNISTKNASYHPGFPSPRVLKYALEAAGAIITLSIIVLASKAGEVFVLREEFGEYVFGRLGFENLDGIEDFLRKYRRLADSFGGVPGEMVALAPFGILVSSVSFCLWNALNLIKDERLARSSLKSLSDSVGGGPSSSAGPVNSIVNFAPDNPIVIHVNEYLKKWPPDKHASPVKCGSPKIADAFYSNAVSEFINQLHLKSPDYRLCELTSADPLTKRELLAFLEGASGDWRLFFLFRVSRDSAASSTVFCSGIGWYLTYYDPRRWAGTAGKYKSDYANLRSDAIRSSIGTAFAALGSFIVLSVVSLMAAAILQNLLSHGTARWWLITSCTAVPAVCFAIARSRTLWTKPFTIGADWEWNASLGDLGLWSLAAQRREQERQGRTQGERVYGVDDQLLIHDLGARITSCEAAVLDAITVCQGAGIGYKAQPRPPKLNQQPQKPHLPPVAGSPPPTPPSPPPPGARPGKRRVI